MLIRRLLFVPLCVALASCGGSDSSGGEGGTDGGGSGGSASVPRELTETFEHPMGVVVHYPPSWKPEGGDATTLVPEGASRDANGLTEKYFIIANPAAGITSVRDAASQMENEIAQVMPFLQRDGAVQWVGSDSAIVRLAGNEPSMGLAMLSNLHVTLHDGMIYALWGIGDEAGITAREAMARKIFDAFTFAELEVDSSIVGNWSRSESMVSGDYTYAMEFTMDLHPDGSLVRTSRGVGEGFDSGDTETGRWSAAGGVLTLSIDGGETLEYRYSIVDGNLVLGVSGNRTIWSR